MDMRGVVQVVALIWLLVSLWLGGLNVLVAATTMTVFREEAEIHPGWKGLLGGVGLLVSGIVAAFLAFGPSGLTLWSILELITLVALPPALFVLFWFTPGLGRTVSRWWPSLRVPARVALLGGTVIIAIIARDPLERGVLVLLALVQAGLLVWMLWIWRDGRARE